MAKLIFRDLLKFRETIGDCATFQLPSENTDNTFFSKNHGFSMATCQICKGYIVRNVIADAKPKKALLGIRMLDYFDKEAALL